MSNEPNSLIQLGWRAFYSQQLALEDLTGAFPARVASVHRRLLLVLSESGEHRVTLPNRVGPDTSETNVTVGDWVLVLNDASRIIRMLERQSLIARIAAGTAPATQPIAANVDTLFVVTSCNADFNASRLERYLALAHEARVTPVIVLTRSDLCADPDSYIRLAQSVAKETAVLPLNATDPERSLASLAPWLEAGQTVAFVGSSGVGKSTLINSLLGVSRQQTQDIRHADAKGRHTTTARYLLRASSGAWLIDTPGMRELKIGAAPMGLSRTFVDVESLARQCRFRDCSHQHETGCAVRTAVAEGRMELRRLESYLKLTRESQRATIPPWKLHQHRRQGGLISRAAQKRRRRDKGQE